MRAFLTALIGCTVAFAGCAGGSAVAPPMDASTSGIRLFPQSAATGCNVRGTLLVLDGNGALRAYSTAPGNALIGVDQSVYLDQPDSVAIDEPANVAYVTEEATGLVRVFHGAQCGAPAASVQRTRSERIGSAAVDSAAQRLYVSEDQNGGDIEIFDTAHGYAAVGLIAGLADPDGMAVDAQAQKLYVADNGGNRVAIFSTQGGHPLLGSIGGLAQTAQVAVDPAAQRLYASEETQFDPIASSIAVYSTASGNALVGTITGLPGIIAGLAVDPKAGRLYVSTYDPGYGPNDTIKVYATSAGFPQLASIGVPPGARDLAVAP